MSRCRTRGSNGDSHASISDLSLTVVLLKVVVLKEFVMKESVLLFKEFWLFLKGCIVLKEASFSLETCCILNFHRCECREGSEVLIKLEFVQGNRLELGKRGVEKPFRHGWQQLVSIT